MPRRLVIMMVAGLVVAGTLGVVLLVRGMTAAGVFLLVGPAIATGANVVMIKHSLARQQTGPARRTGAATGRRLAPGSFPDHAVLANELAWTGGGNVATKMGRMNATWPLAVLVLRAGTLTLRFRPKRLGLMFGVSSYLWNVGEVAVAYPVRGRFIRLNRGVAIESTTKPLAYFWALHPEIILAALAACGVPVDWTERNITLWP